MESQTQRTIYTIGHSTWGVEEFIDLLKAHGVRLLIDVRTIPKSRHNPQFNEEKIKQSLKKSKIGYQRLPALGGLRHTHKDSVNLGWRNASFRGYADYMGTPEFTKSLEELQKSAKQKTTAIMCAEAVPWRCHRSLIADALSVKRWRVLHIMSKTKAQKHVRTQFLRVRKGTLTYPQPKAEPITRPLF